MKMNKIKFDGFERITKAEAKKLYNSGKNISIVPCKAVPGSVWWAGFVNNENGRNFENLINEFIYYNCNNQVGKYPAFYKEV